MNADQPVLFVSHGSPMFALQPGAAGAALASLASSLPTPRVVLVISPHWETPIPTVGSAVKLQTIHDFSGFDPALYRIHYPATGCPEAAREVVVALRTAGLEADFDDTRGLDHGAWVPLRHMFADAEVPIVPLSIQHPLGPRHAFRIGEALAPLTKRGFLIIASGNITHNLYDWQQALRTGAVDAGYAREFSDWVHTRIERGQIEELLDYRRVHPAGTRAQPRDEHLLPLFTALGAAGKNARADAFHRGICDHVIAMDGYMFHSRNGFHSRHDK